MEMPRKLVQVLFALAGNCAFLLGQPLPNKIYQGSLKQVCFPGLNCYACPYAVGACPIGSLQTFIVGGAYHFSVYLAGFFLLSGGMLGRLVCGWLCPMGLFQELLHKIPSRTFRLPRWFSFIRWPFLILLVILIPLITLKPSYCTWICPAGTLEGALPFSIFDEYIREMIGWIFYLKLGLLAATCAGSIFWFRPFCRIGCPLGLIYGFFNRIAVLGISFHPRKCISCMTCQSSCPVNLNPQAGEFNKNDCIRCLNCVRTCPNTSLTFGLTAKAEIRDKIQDMGYKMQNMG